MIWFKGFANRYNVEYSDDGTPEPSDETMTITALLLWNFGKRICSRNFHYLLYTVSESEKNKMCEILRM